MRLAIAGLFASAAIAAAPVVEGPLVEVRFESGDTIRAVAERHLKDADLWPQILELSGVGSVLELREGVVLRIPQAQVAAADTALGASLAAIQRANAEGAQVFAPVEITSAIDLRDEALAHRKRGEWAPTTEKADRSTETARTALALSLEARDRAAEAVVSDVQGAVEGRKPAEPRWSGRSLREILVEFEEVRTLSASTAQVTFRDLSRLRLNPNSNALIRTMRTDPLTGAERTSVNLVSGDFYALLSGLGARDSFEVAAPGIESAEVSRDFWIGHDGAASRVANYDEAALTLETRGEAIALGRNEGAVIPLDGGAARRVDVLDAPGPLEPADGRRFARPSVTLEWAAVGGAAGYWVEIARDVAYERMHLSEWGLGDTRFAVEGLGPGDYHWRVSALDALGLPGARSLSRAFAVSSSDAPPYLAVLEPAEGAILRETPITLRGEVDPLARLSIDGRYVGVSETGAFAFEVAPAPGPVSVAFEATDEAGKTTRRVRAFTYRPDGVASLTLAPDAPRDAEGRLLGATAELAVDGVADAEPGSRVVARGEDGAVASETEVAADGRFRLVVPAAAAPTRWRLEIVAVSGAVEAEATFETLRDVDPPAIAFDAPPPAFTAVGFVEIAGEAGDAASLRVNGADVPLAGGRFDVALPLATGENAVEFVAVDRVGNVGLRRATIVRDSDPPVVGRGRITRPAGAAGPIEIVVEATDASGLRQAAPFTARVGGAERRGFLRYDEARGAYLATLPPAPGALSLVDATVEDYAGNRTERRFE